MRGLCSWKKVRKEERGKRMEDGGWRDKEGKRSRCPALISGLTLLPVGRNGSNHSS